MSALEKLLIGMSFESYGISPINLSFGSGAQEESYRAFVWKVTSVHLRVSMLMALLLVLFFGCLDSFVYQDKAILLEARLIRFLVLVPVPIIVIAASYHANYLKYSQLVGATGISLVGAGLSFLTYKGTAIILVHVFPAIVTAIIYSFIFVGLFFPNAFLVGISLVAAYLFAIWTVDMPLPMGISVTASVVTIFILVALAAYQKELISRQLFVSEVRERDGRAKQVQSDKRYIAWLQQLAEFLRHEVRQPIAQISSSIEIVQLAHSSDERIKPYLASAALGTQHVWNLVERASQATDAEAFVHQGKPEWTDIAHLVVNQVEAYRQTNSGMSFSIQGLVSARVFADPTLLKEAIGNLLGNAASYARAESSVQISLEADQTTVLLRISNKGPSIQTNSEVLFGPFASTRSGPASEHQGLGLYLVRLIAEQHGGTATICNLADNSGVEASIRLPLSN